MEAAAMAAMAAAEAAAARRPFVTSEEIARLVLDWLRRQRLLRTAATLEVEAAAMIQTVEGTPRPLGEILNDYVVLKAQAVDRQAALSRWSGLPPLQHLVDELLDVLEHYRHAPAAEPADHPDVAGAAPGRRKRQRSESGVAHGDSSDDVGDAAARGQSGPTAAASAAAGSRPAGSPHKSRKSERPQRFGAPFPNDPVEERIVRRILEDDRAQQMLANNVYRLLMPQSDEAAYADGNGAPHEEEDGAASADTAGAAVSDDAGVHLATHAHEDLIAEIDWASVLGTAAMAPGRSGGPDTGEDATADPDDAARKLDEFLLALHGKRAE